MSSFTDTFIKNLKPKEKKYVIREDRGFAIQVRPSGKKTFLYIFELNKQKGYITIGDYPSKLLKDARKEYNDAYDLVKGGIDPRDIKREQAEAKAKAAKEHEAAIAEAKRIEAYSFESLITDGIPNDFVPVTIEHLAATYYMKYSLLHHSPRVQKNFLYEVRGNVIDAIGKRRITDFRRSDAIKLIEKIAERAPGQARNILKDCRQMFDYALQREWVDVQPFLAITKAVPKTAPKEDTRALDDAEIVKAWSEIEKSSSSKVVKKALKLILVTAQRPGEIVQMHSDQINGRWWTLPESAAKNNREHRIYLSDTALRLIGDAKGYIFPSGRPGRGHISENSLSQAINRGYVDENSAIKMVGINKIKARKDKYFGMQPWSPHDLRRTARTGMSRLGIADRHIEEVLNHAQDRLVRTYDKHRYDAQKREALIAWEALLVAIINGTEHEVLQQEAV